MAVLIMFNVCIIPSGMGNLKNLKAIIFDFGGTLDLDGVHWLNAFYILYEKLSLPIEQSIIKKVFYEVDKHLETIPERHELTLEPMIRAHINLQFKLHGLYDPQKEKEMFQEFCSTVRQNFKRNVLLLKDLKAKYKLGLVSNFYGNVSILCEEAGFAPFLDVIVDSDKVGLRKPDPEIFKLALSRLNVGPPESAFVGDSFSQDIKPAKGVGMKTIWLKTEHTAPFPGNWEDFVDVKINSLGKLKEILL